MQAANAAAANAAPHPSDYDPTNTTLFIGGLSAGVSEDDLRNLFGRFGEIVYTKIPPGKGCGFVQFVQRAAAEAAMAAMQARAWVRAGCTVLRAVALVLWCAMRQTGAAAFELSLSSGVELLC